MVDASLLQEESMVHGGMVMEGEESMVDASLLHSMSVHQPACKGKGTGTGNGKGKR
jgi:hypothetical protein